MIHNKLAILLLLLFVSLANSKMAKIDPKSRPGPRTKWIICKRNRDCPKGYWCPIPPGVCAPMPPTKSTNQHDHCIWHDELKRRCIPWWHFAMRKVHK